MVDWEAFEKKLVALARDKDEAEAYRRDIELLKKLGEGSFNALHETFRFYHNEAIEDELSFGDALVYKKMYEDHLEEHDITVDDWEDEDGDIVFDLEERTSLCYEKVYEAFLKKYNIPKGWENEDGFIFSRYYKGKPAEKFPANDPKEWMGKYFPKEFDRGARYDAWYFIASETIDDGVWENMYETAYLNTAQNCFDENDLEKIGVDISAIPEDMEICPLEFLTVKMIVDNDVPEK
jgi:hypothetical protein